MSSRNTSAWGGLALAFAAILFLFAVPVHAQLPTGTILGTVKDASGGLVPNATITVRNAGTGLVRTATTESDGQFRIPALAVGTYEVKVENAGFKTESQTGLVLDVSQELVLNFTLQVGSSEQQVQVTGEAPLVNTTSSSLGGLVDEDKMADLPLNGRNYIDLTLLQTGVTKNVAQAQTSSFEGTWFSSNGAPTRSNNVLLDGAPLMTFAGGSTSTLSGTTLGVEGIREYKVITNAFSAEYGMQMGSQTVMVSKSGTNNFHGTAFEYLRNSALDARNYFDSAVGSGGHRLPEFRRNNFGGSLGGPIQKNKTFFFGTYEGLRQNLGITTVDNVFPTACHTEAHATGKVDNACISTLAAGQTVTVNPVMIPFLDLYPAPNLPNNQFTFPSFDPTQVDYGQMRVDHNLSSSDTIFGRYTIDKSYQTNTITQQSAARPAFPDFRLLSTTQDQFATFAENHIFSPALLNTFRFSVSRTNIAVNNLYFNGVDSSQYSFVQGQFIGDISVGGGISAFGPHGNTPQFGIQNIYTLSDDVFYTRGRHAMKFGTLINRYTDGFSAAYTNKGQLTFSGVQNFLTGTTTSYNALTPGSLANKYYIYGTYGFYGQDDWRVTSRLTLNLGLRYEFNTVPVEQNGREYAIRNVRTDTSTVQGPIFVNPSLHDFSPRVGFAFDPFGKGKTSIRSAFGIYYDIPYSGTIMQQQAQGLPPLTSSSTGSGVITKFPVVFANPGTTLSTMNYYIKQPYVMQYNFTVEQQLPGQFGLTVSYVGSRGIHLLTATEGNPILPTAFVNGQPEWQPYICAGTPSSINATGCTANPAYKRVNTVWNTSRLLDSRGNSWYNSLQVAVNRRFNHGLEAQLSYTWGQALDTTQTIAINSDCTTTGSDHGAYSDNLAYVKGPSCFDATQNMHLNVLYHFPKVNSDGLLKYVANGWWVGNIVSANSGYPFTPYVSTQRSESGFLAQAFENANAITAPATVTISGKTYNFVSFNHNTVTTGNPHQWFNPLMFGLGPIGQLGNAGRDILRGPGLVDWDFSLVKDTAMPVLGEAGAVEFRAEFFNLMNHANFALPNGNVFTGALTDTTPYDAPLATAGQITSTVTTSRQIQLALKIIF